MRSERYLIYSRWLQEYGAPLSGCTLGVHQPTLSPTHIFPTCARPVPAARAQPIQLQLRRHVLQQNLSATRVVHGCRCCFQLVIRTHAATGQDCCPRRQQCRPGHVTCAWPFPFSNLNQFHRQPLSRRCRLSSTSPSVRRPPMQLRHRNNAACPPPGHLAQDFRAPCSVP